MALSKVGWDVFEFGGVVGLEYPGLRGVAIIFFSRMDGFMGFRGKYSKVTNEEEVTEPPARLLEHDSG